jgi:hypothetical protein
VIAIGFALGWAGYAIVMWGYCLVRDYDVTIGGLLKGAWPGVSAGSAPGTVSSQVVPTPSGQPTTAQRLTGQ